MDYMTLMMAAPMAAVMLVAMRSIFGSRRLNLVLAAGAALIFAASFIAMRSQTSIGDKEFLRSMIPHHSGAIPMCEEAVLTDREIVEPCGRIVGSQRAEIAQMKAILARY